MRDSKVSEGKEIDPQENEITRSYEALRKEDWNGEGKRSWCRKYQESYMAYIFQKFKVLKDVWILNSSLEI